LPCHVDELDVAHGDAYYWIHDEEGPLRNFDTTSTVNAKLPLLARVCCEARDVALKAGSFRPDEICQLPDNSWWLPDNRHVGKIWRSKAPPEIAHLNWNTFYCDNYGGGEINASECLSWLEQFLLKRKGGCGSVLSRDLIQLPQKRQMMESPNRHAKWMIVMQIVVIHALTISVASTGLFGLLGDAPVQICDVKEEAKIDAMYDLAHDCDDVRPVRSFQDLRRYPTDHWEERLTGTAGYEAPKDFVLTTVLRPPIMFRLCPLMCDRPDLKSPGARGPPWLQKPVGL
jgi:hypothetical protein